MVVIHMRDCLFAAAIAHSLQADKRGNFTVQQVAAPEEVIRCCRQCGPYAVLMEVSGNAPYTLEERLKIRDEVKESHPQSKVVLIVDENSEKTAARQVREAKRSGRIDQFIYGSISASYLVALMDTL